MAYTLKQTSTDFVGGKNILASEHVQYVHGGATLDGEKFPAGLIEVGTLIARNKTTGKYEPFEESFLGDDVSASTHDNCSILNENHNHDGETDAVTGAVIIVGSVYEAKLPVTVPENFKKANPNIFYVTHIAGTP